MRTSRSYLYAVDYSTLVDHPFGWIDTVGAEGLTINGWYATDLVGQFVAEGSDDQQDTAGLIEPNDAASIAPYSLPAGCLHAATAQIALGVYTANQGIPIDLAVALDGGAYSFVLSVKNFARWFRLRLVYGSGGAAGDLNLRYTLRYPR